MKTAKYTALVFLALAARSGNASTPRRITVPAHLEYCVTSRPVAASEYELPEVREVLFQNLYKQIEQETLTAQLPSIGVAFVDAVEAGTDASASEKTYVVRECVVVPALGSPPLPAAGVRQVAERTLTATICPSTSIEACKRDIKKAIQQETNGASDTMLPVIWRTRPALRPDDSVDNLVTSMSDAKLRKLKDSATSVTVQDNLVVLSAEVTAAGK